MSLHEWLKFNKLDFPTILKIERSYYENSYTYKLNDKELALLYEWLSDPERLRDGI